MTLSTRITFDRYLQVLRVRGLFAKLKKCEFWLREVAFLGHVISELEVSVDPKSVEAVKTSPDQPMLPRFEALSDLWGTKDMEGFSKITTPLTGITRKGAKLLSGIPQSLTTWLTKSCATSSAVQSVGAAKKVPYLEK